MQPIADKMIMQDDNINIINDIINGDDVNDSDVYVIDRAVSDDTSIYIDLNDEAEVSSISDVDHEVYIIEGETSNGQSIYINLDDTNDANGLILNSPDTEVNVIEGESVDENDGVELIDARVDIEVVWVSPEADNDRQPFFDDDSDLETDYDFGTDESLQSQDDFVIDDIE